MKKSAWIWIGIVAIVLVIIVYSVGQSLNNSGTTSASEGVTSTQSVATTPMPQSAAATDDNLFTKQQSCSQLLTSFENNTYAQSDTGSVGALNNELESTGWVFNTDNFVVGYSPTLNTCVGGYTSTSYKDYCAQGIQETPCTDYQGMYVIVNLNTNQTISPLYSYDSVQPEKGTEAQEYQEYDAKLLQLTNGQIQLPAMPQ